MCVCESCEFVLLEKDLQKGSICQYQPKKDKNSMKSILPGVNEERLASFKLGWRGVCGVNHGVNHTWNLHKKRKVSLVASLVSKASRAIHHHAVAPRH